MNDIDGERNDWRCKMDEVKMDAIAGRIAGDDPLDASSEAMAKIDAAVDAVIAAFQAIDENLSIVKPEGAPQQAALDNIREAMATGVHPYFADVVKALSFFDEPSAQ